MTTNRNVMRLHEYQLEVMKSEEALETADTAAQIKSSFETIKMTLSFLRSILDLDDEDYEKLQDMDLAATQDLAQRVSGYLMGMSDEDIQSVQEPSPKDQ